MNSPSISLLRRAEGREQRFATALEPSRREPALPRTTIAPSTTSRPPTHQVSGPRSIQPHQRNSGRVPPDSAISQQGRYHQNGTSNGRGIPASTIVTGSTMGLAPIAEGQDSFPLARGALPAVTEIVSIQTNDCMICLEPITTLCNIQPCGHSSFDFTCILPWLTALNTRTTSLNGLTCPLCRSRIESIRHNIRSPTDYKIYIIKDHFRSHRRRTPQPSLPMPSNTSLHQGGMWDIGFLHHLGMLEVNNTGSQQYGIVDARGEPPIEGPIPDANWRERSKRE